MASGETRVPEDYPSLAAALEAAGPAACIVLGKGTFSAKGLKIHKSLQLRGQGAATVLDLHQTRLIVRGKDVGLVVDTLTATNGLLWVYEGGAVTLTECTLQGVGVQVGSTFRGDRDQTRNNVTPHVNDTGTEALISGCTLVSEQQNLTPAAVRNGAQLVIENSNISGVGTRCVDVGGKDTVAQLLDCDLRSDVPCIPNPFEQWNSCIGASVSLGATLRLEKCCFQNFGSAAMTASDASSLKVLKCKVEECYRGLWAWSAAEVWIRHLEQKEIGHLGIQLNETVEFTDATPKRELHIPTQYHTLEDAHSAAKDGDLLVLQPGTFHATGKRLVITKDVELEGAGEDSSEVIVHNSELVVSGCKAKIHNLQFSQSLDNAVTVVSGGHAVLEDCEFVAPEGSGVEVKGKGSCIVVRHCVFHSGQGHGVLAHEGADALVVNSEFEGMARSALKVADLGSKLSSQFCVIRSSHDTGIDIGDAAAATIRSCDILQNQSDGVCVHGEAGRAVVLETKVVGNGGRGIFGWRAAALTLLGSAVSNNALGDLEIEEGCVYNGEALPNHDLVPQALPKLPEHRRPSRGGFGAGTSRPNHGSDSWEFVSPIHAERAHMTEAQRVAKSLPLSPAMKPGTVCPSIEDPAHVPTLYATEVQVGGVHEFIGRYDTDEARQKARHDWKNQHKWGSDSHSEWRKLSSLSGWMPPVGYKSTLQRELELQQREQDRWKTQKAIKDRGGAHSYFPDIGCQK